MRRRKRPQWRGDLAAIEASADRMASERDELRRELAKVTAQRDELRRVIGDVRSYARQEAGRAVADALPCTCLQDEPRTWPKCPVHGARSHSHGPPVHPTDVTPTPPSPS